MYRGTTKAMYKNEGKKNNKKKKKTKKEKN